MDRAVAIVGPDTLEKASIGKVATHLEERGFQIQDLMLMKLSETDLYNFSSISDELVPHSTILKLGKGPSLILSLTHPSLSTAYKSQGLTKYATDNGLLLFNAKKLKIVEFWFGRMR